MPDQPLRVVLLHGLWMRGISMRWHAARLADAGFKPELFDYASVLADPERAMPRLASCLSKQPCHVVGHSLGGVLTLSTLRRHPDLVIGRVVCLGSPLCGSAVARGAGERSWRRVTVGRSAAMLQQGCPEVPEGVEVGMVAGDRPFGLGQLFGHVEGPHDGTVAISETRPPGLRDHVVVPSSHSSLLFSRVAARQTGHFLETGHFLHAA